MKKPVIVIEDGLMKTSFDLSESFNDQNMAEKYNNMQALIDMTHKDEECPNEHGPE